MKQIIVLLSVVAINIAIKVPPWNKNNNVRLSYQEIRPRRADVYIQPRYLNPQYGANIRPSLDVQISPTNNEWSPLLPKNKVTLLVAGSKPKYYKKLYSRQIPKRKQYFNTPSSTKISSHNYKNLAPYITYKKPKDFVFVPHSSVNNFYDSYPRLSNKQKSQTTDSVGNVQPQNNLLQFYTNFGQTYNLPENRKPSNISPGFTQFSQNGFIPSISHPTQKPEPSITPTIPQQSLTDSFNNYEPIKNNLLFFQNIDTSSGQESVPKTNGIGYYSHLHKNYRDDKTYEPEQNDPHFIKEDQKFERDEGDKSSHELPADIPTKPIYPGQGLWAKPGLKHKPFITKQQYDELEEDKVKPDGYDTFISGQELFEKNNDKFTQNIENFPKQHKFGSSEESKESSEESEPEEKQKNEETNEEDEEETFVPMKLYAQVRASENKEHLPAEDDGTLREAIKESKIHTVYTEEGYEDSAYDHAGHEKEAENDEGFEDLEREKIEKKEKKIPHKKYNLHLPKYTKATYSNGNDILSDEEIETLKQQELGLVDPDAAGTQFEEIGNGNYSEDNDYPKEDEVTTKPPRKRTNNFISTKETKTMTTKENDDGDTETEISSKVNIILQPTNSTKSHKYVKIYPKIYKTIHRKKTHPPESQIVAKENKTFNFSDIFIEEIIPTTDIIFTKLPSTEFEGLQDEIPITTLPTTAIPKPNLEAIDSISKAFSNIQTKRRVKRYTNDFSNLRLHQFLPEINHKLGKLEENPKTKYPYYDNYKEEGLDENSPLRYSENLKNIPQKTGKRMVFYEEADRRVACPEIETTVNPIPEKVLDAEKNKAEDRNDKDNEDSDEPVDVVKQPSTPRLSGLGNKIDCLKSRYFGDNPFDSPFFKEETVGSLTPIFNALNHEKSIINKQDYNRINSLKSANNVIDDGDLKKNVLKDIKYRTKILKAFEDKTSTTQETPKLSTSKIIKLVNIDDSRKREDRNNNTSTPASVNTVSLLTTPKYTVTLKPEHIYHQIELLKFLPTQQNTNQADQKRFNHTIKSTKHLDTLDVDYLTPESTDNDLVIPDINQIGIREVGEGRPFLIFDINKFLPNQPKKDKEAITNSTGTSRQAKALGENKPSEEIAELPEAEELRRRRKIRKKRPPFQIFDINQYLPTPRPIFNEIITSSTVLPKYKVLSEVFYKDDIKPNEQLHVFTDILNNIKNSSQEQADAAIQSSEHVSAIFGLKKRPNDSKLMSKIPYYQDSYLQAYGDQEVDGQYYSSQIANTTTAIPTTTTSARSVTYRGNVKYHNRKSPGRIYSSSTTSTTPAVMKDREEKFKLYLALLEAKKQPQYTTRVPNNYGHTIPVTEEVTEFIDKTTKVMGLMPPGIQRYKQIYHPKRDNSIHVAIPGKKLTRLNQFFVVGMRPPPKQHIILYSDFINKNQIANKRKVLIRGKRNTKDSYASLSRNRGQQEEQLEKVKVTSENDDDDYVPHRPKNYYYDEKTGKIVYLTTKKPQQSEEEEEIEYEEIIEEPPSTKTSKPKQDLIFATATPPPEGQSYLDFVNKLRNASDYKFIPDPTTTEKSPEDATTTVKPESTTPPEFLNILAKVRQNNQYKLIEDKKKTTSTTTEAPEEIVDEEDEAPLDNIQNSPGGQNINPFEKLGIFDVTDFIPKIRNYLPKTAYDITKYKTIERSTSKPNLDDLEGEENSSELTTQKPFMIITEEASHTDSLNEATITKETEKVPIVLQRRRYTTVSTTTDSSTSYTPDSIENPTTKSLLQYRRRRPTTLRSVITTKRISTTTTPTSADLQVNHSEILRRNYRRRPTRIRNEPTSPKYLNEQEEEDEDTTKVLKRRSDSTGSTTAKIQMTRFVDAFKKYHRNKKHGGSYKKSDDFVDATTENTMAKPIPEVITVHEDVEIIADYDKRKRHGGNYRKIIDNLKPDNEKEDIDNDYEIINVDAKTAEGKPLLINLLAKHTDIKEERLEHLDNNDQDNTSPKAFSLNTDKEGRRTNFLQNKPHIRERIISNKFRKTDRNQKRKHVTEPPLMRLTDIVPKPEAFYKDPTLPISVNMLENMNKPSSDEISSIISSTESFDDSEEYRDITRKAAIVKDPSKRLYYYAPI